MPVEGAVMLDVKKSHKRIEDGLSYQAYVLYFSFYLFLKLLLFFFVLLNNDCIALVQ